MPFSVNYDDVIQMRGVCRHFRDDQEPCIATNSQSTRAYNTWLVGARSMLYSVDFSNENMQIYLKYQRKTPGHEG